MGDEFSIKQHIPASVFSSSSSVVATLTPTIDYIRTYGEDYWNELHELDRPIIMTEQEDERATPSKTIQNNKNKKSSSASSSSTSRTNDHPFASSSPRKRRRRNSNSITRKSKSHRRRSSRSSTSTSTSNNKYNGGRIPFGSPSQLKYSSSSASASALSMSSSSISHVTPTHRNVNSNNSSFTRPTFTEAYWKEKSTNAKKKKKKQQHDYCGDYPPTDSEPGPPCESTQPMLVQPQLTPKMRSILLDWLIELSEHFTFASSTLHLAINLVDRVLASGKDLGPDPGGSCGGDNVRDMSAAVVATPAATSRLRP